MQALSFPGDGRVEIIEIPRPTLRDPGDAIVLVTTAAIGPWDIDRFLGVGEERVIPGGEFAGLVVETGETVSTIDLDDLVANTVHHTNQTGHKELFGSNSLPGGHAEYVRVPNADQTLTKIAVSGEERAVLTGGTVGLGVGAATSALRDVPNGTFAVVGCDPIGMTALIALKNAGMGEKLLAVEDHVARRTLASNFAHEAIASSQIEAHHGFDAVIVGSIRDIPVFEAISKLVNPCGHIIFTEPYGQTRIMESGFIFPDDVSISSASWPTNVDAGKIVIALQIRRLDLTPLVSHVIPFDEAQDAYEAAAGPGPGAHKVLLKP
jgi:threonine dehydrogenase-like Zn-dependent dehydrogenase